MANEIISTGMWKLAENPILESVTIIMGDKTITIPTPPIRRSPSDPLEALFAAVVGLAVLAGIEPVETGEKG